MKKYVIKNDFQVITLLDLGATLYKWIAFKDKTNIILTHKNLSSYLKNNNYLGSNIGRCANRIKNGYFFLNGKKNELTKNFVLKNHIHGGEKGFNFKIFDIINHEKNKISFKYFSKDGEEGYPGNLSLIITYELIENQLKLSFDAKSDLDTIVNLTNHAYFNLSRSEENILNHELYVDAAKYLETDENLIPTGNVFSIKKLNIDLKSNNTIENHIKPIINGKEKGFDHFFIFENNKKVILSLKNKKLTITTNYPGVQIYSLNHLPIDELLNRNNIKHAGIAFEMQYEPDAINHDNFSSIILKKNELYHKEIIYTISE